MFLVQVSSGILSKKCKDTEATNNLKTGYILSGDETQEICLTYDAVDGASINHKVIHCDLHLTVIYTGF